MEFQRLSAQRGGDGRRDGQAGRQAAAAASREGLGWGAALGESEVKSVPRKFRRSVLVL